MARTRRALPNTDADRQIRGFATLEVVKKKSTDPVETEEDKEEDKALVVEEQDVVDPKLQHLVESVVAKVLYIPIRKTNGERRTVTGVVLEPDSVDAHGDIIPAEVILDAAEDFLANINVNTTLGLQHKEFDHPLELVQSWVVPDSDITINNVIVKRGSWVIVVRVLSDKIWQLIKDGKITGFSIGGTAKTQVLKSKKAKRIFLALKVGEISLVDEGANEKTIIVAKRKAEDEATMGTDETEIVNIQGDGPSEAVAKSVQSLITSLLDFQNTEKAKGEAKAGDKTGDKGKGKMPAFLAKLKDALTKSGLGGDLAATVAASVEAAFTDEGSASEVAKSVTPEELTMKALEALQSALAKPAASQDDVSKAKTFTPKREQALKDVAQKVIGLLEELGIDKAEFGASGIPSTPNNATPMPAVQDRANTGGAGEPSNKIQKSMDAEVLASAIGAAISKAMEPVTSAVTAIDGRLTSIEKARAPSTQVPDDPTPKLVAKGKSLWRGVV